MQAVLRAADRGTTRVDWLTSFHSFSFGEYHNPARMGFRTLRVLNDDVVAPGRGFGTHPHRDMEIVTWVLSGELAHHDSLGHGETLRPGLVQRMTAGRGILHSEMNPSRTTPAHFLQVWIVPRQKGLDPAYEDRFFDEAGRRNQWQLLASPDGAQKSFVIAQEAWIRVADLEAGRAAELPIPSGAGVWLHVARGKVRAGEVELSAGDALAVEEIAMLSVQAMEPAQVLAFTLA